MYMFASFLSLSLSLSLPPSHPHHLRYSSTEQVKLVQLLWQLWKDIPSYGHRASQFVDLLGFCTISTPDLLEKEAVCSYVSEQAIQLLRKQNSKVASHSNAHVYSQLASLVDFDGYYLESEPCLICNEPEVPYSVRKSCTDHTCVLVYLSCDDHMTVTCYACSLA